jgi:hypothetical protein
MQSAVMNPPREQKGVTDEPLLVVFALEPGGGVMTIRLAPGEACRMPLRQPVVGADGTRYTAVDLTVARV